METRMRELTPAELEQVSGGVDWGVTAAGLGVVVGAIAPLLSATALGWGFGSAVAYLGGHIAGTGLRM